MEWWRYTVSSSESHVLFIPCSFTSLASFRNFEVGQSFERDAMREGRRLEFWSNGWSTNGNVDICDEEGIWTASDLIACLGLLPPSKRGDPFIRTGAPIPSWGQGLEYRRGEGYKLIFFEIKAGDVGSIWQYVSLFHCGCVENLEKRLCFRPWFRNVSIQWKKHIERMVRSQLIFSSNSWGLAWKGVEK